MFLHSPLSVYIYPANTAALFLKLPARQRAARLHQQLMPRPHLTRSCPSNSSPAVCQPDPHIHLGLHP